MITLLICEDEAVERQALRDLVELHFRDKLRIVDEAENGRRAIELARRHKPEIIIMDIQMPVYDGLTASRHIREIVPETEIIISTAYGQFDYARRAIGIGVFDYMVKPVTPAEFIEGMHRLIGKVVRKRARLESNTRATRLGTLARELVEQELLLKLFRGGGPVHRSPAQLFWLLDIKECSWATALFRLRETSGDREEIMSRLRLSLKHYFSQVIVTVLVDEIAAVLASPKGSTDLEELRKEIARDFVPDALSGQGYSDILQLPAGTETAFAQARGELLRELDLPKKHEEITRRIIELENQLCDRLVCEETREAEVALARLASAISEQPQEYELPQYARNLYAWIHGFVDRFFNGRVEPVDTAEFRAEVEAIRTSTDFVRCFGTLIQKTGIQIAARKRSASDNLIADLREYIASHIDEQISVANLADIAGLSTGHLRKLFREVSGEGVKEYILNRKMHHAGELLRGKKMMIKEIAAATGFSDQNYFSRVFKEHFGVSPREYMNR